MPRLTTYGIDLELVKKASVALCADISQSLSIPSEYVTIQVNQDRFISQGNEVQADSFVEVCLFDRGHEKEDEIASIITKQFTKLGIPSLDVYLTRLERRRYYENGIHF